MPSALFPVENSSYSIISLINTSLRYAPPVGKEVKIAEIIIKFVVPISQNKNKINGIIHINE